jgi:hypothetical protein
MVFVLELMNVIENEDNLQCLVLFYFDLLFGVHSEKTTPIPLSEG